MSDTTTDPYALARDAADALRELTGAETHDVALVMGSGWVPAAEMLGETVAEFPVTDLPGFPPPAVAGHAGTVRSVAVGEKRALVFLGRTHLLRGPRRRRRRARRAHRGRRRLHAWSCSPTAAAGCGRRSRRASRC